MFVEVHSVDKKVPVILNLDNVREIAPLSSGGCHIFTYDSVIPMHVSDHYNQFKQFVLETVTSAHIAQKVESIAKSVVPKEKNPVVIPKL
jgi:hypothetical protein